MNENINTVVDNTKKKATSAGRTAHISATVVLFVLATIAFVMTVCFSVTFFNVLREHNALGNAGESQLSTGIAQAVLLIAILVTLVIGAILSLIDIVLSVTVFKRMDGGVKRLGLTFLILNCLYVFTTLVLFSVILIVI